MQTSLKVSREDQPYVITPWHIENFSDQEMQQALPLFFRDAVKAIEENEFVKKNASRFAQLTRREKEILALVAKGHTSREIGDTLYISKHTVDTHRRNIIDKLKLECLACWKQFAKSFGLG